MRKDIILLTASKKHGNYCTAGVDIRTGEWVRIVSDNESIQHATTLNQMTYADGSVAQVLDIISIECKGKVPTYYQPENYLMDDKYYWEKTGRATLQDVLDVHPPEVKSYIFYDSSYSIPHELLNLVNGDAYSLMLISVENPIINVQQWPSGKKITMAFTYNGRRYRYFSITDTFGKEFLNNNVGEYIILGDFILIVSLGELHTDNKHYKLIAKVYRV